MTEKLTWDEAKRQKTLKERGLDFADMAAFDWDNALTLEDSYSNRAELRFISIGHLPSALVVAVWCYRDDETRIISLRRATRKERKLYEQETL